MVGLWLGYGGGVRGVDWEGVGRGLEFGAGGGWRWGAGRDGGGRAGGGMNFIFGMWVIFRKFAASYCIYEL